jgi:hypothetical protein
VDSIHVSLDYGNNPCADYSGLNQAISTFRAILDQLGIHLEQRSFFEHTWSSIAIPTDTLELDNFSLDEGLSDLLPGHVERQLRKAYCTFSTVGSSRIM